MKGVLFALLAVSFLCTLGVAWDEDPRCTCDRRRRRQLQNMHDQSSVPEPVSHGMDTLIRRGEVGGSTKDQDVEGVGGIVQPNNNASTGMLNNTAGNSFRAKQTKHSRKFGPTSILPNSNSSSVLLRGGPQHTEYNRQLQSSFHFQVKMHWEEGFCWQCEWRERKWCWQCEGGNCNEGDKIQTRVCSGSSRQRFTRRDAGGNRVRISPLSRPDLCLEMISDKRFRLKQCDDNEDDQEFVGFRDDGDEFELFPRGQTERCFTQQHDPKSYEEVFADVCRTARGDKTSEWAVYRPYGRPGGGGGPSPTPRPQQEQIPTSSGSCIYNLNLSDGEYIQDGQRRQSPDDSNLYLEQQDNGLLRVRDNGRTIWDSGRTRSTGDYWAQLQGDGNLIIWEGNPKRREDRVWKSNSSRGNDDYFVALDCDKRYIGIYKGRPSRPGERIWRERTGSSSPPSPTPGNRPTPDSGRTNIKHLGSDYCKPSRKCGLCEGDCDDDDDCEGNLVCKQRDPNESIDGCRGGSSDRSAGDYCAPP